MKKTYLFMIIMCVLVSGAFAADVLVPADVSCRTDLTNPDLNKSDSSKLSIRSDASAAKSWIRFDQLGDYDLSLVRGAILRLAFHEDEGTGHFDVSAVNDNYTTYIDWAEKEITWNNAPGNNITDYAALDSNATTSMGTINFTNAVAGDQITIDVFPAVQSDTDGIIQFVLHNGSSLFNCATHDHPGGEAYWPTLILTFPPPGADYPDPGIDDVVPATQPSLSWINPDPNDGVSLINCDVYLGTEPNVPAMDKIVLEPGENSVAINTTNFPTKGNLANNTTYFWFVDCHDPSAATELIPGEMWSFYVGQAPTVNAGDDQTVWLETEELTINLNGTTSDDGPYTILWTKVDNGSPAVTITPNDIDDPSVTFTERGDYEFTLTANDGVLETSDTVRIVVGDDACDASHLQTGDDYNIADENQDCIVDMLDFVALIADSWLNCTDELTNCN